MIYHEVVRPITRKALKGYNGSILMYGQTTSGKTFTMLGSQRQPGILPCTVRDVFKGLTASGANNLSSGSKVVQISYLEIYNESINDLFNKEATNLKLTSDEHGATVSGL